MYTSMHTLAADSTTATAIKPCFACASSAETGHCHEQKLWCKSVAHDCVNGKGESAQPVLLCAAARLIAELAVMQDTTWAMSTPRSTPWQPTWAWPLPRRRDPRVFALRPHRCSHAALDMYGLSLLQAQFAVVGGVFAFAAAIGCNLADRTCRGAGHGCGVSGAGRRVCAWSGAHKYHISTVELGRARWWCRRCWWAR